MSPLYEGFILTNKTQNKRKKGKKKVNKKITIGLIIASIMLIGIVSANLLSFFGKIEGNVNVEAPVFYLNGEHEDGGVYHNLLVDEIPQKEEIYFWNGQRLIFKTEDLGVDEFYKVEFNAKIWMRTNNSGNTIQARFIKLNQDNHEKTICEVDTPVEITSTSNFWKKEFSCSSSGEIDLTEYDRIGLEIRGNGNETQDYEISVGEDRADGMSRIEVTAL